MPSSPSGGGYGSSPDRQPQFPVHTHRKCPRPTRDHVTTTIDFAVEGMHCGACMTTIEGALSALPGVAAARANLTARRVSAEINPDRIAAQDLIGALDRAGYRAAEIVDARTARDAARADDLLRRLGVAGFAAANIMLLSVSVWAGLASDMERSAQSLFHWLSALIALPAIAYAAEPFYRSAASALRARRLNMDVPISLGITLATAMSLYQTGRGSDQVYFDAAITLTFFLLIGRYLDEEVRVQCPGRRREPARPQGSQRHRHRRATARRARFPRA